jgi:hypothetical protein
MYFVFPDHFLRLELYITCCQVSSHSQISKDEQKKNLHHSLDIILFIQITLQIIFSHYSRILIVKAKHMIKKKRKYLFLFIYCSEVIQSCCNRLLMEHLRCNELRHLWDLLFWWFYHLYQIYNDDEDIQTFDMPSHGLQKSFKINVAR